MGAWVGLGVGVWAWVCANECAWVVVGPTVLEHADTYMYISINVDRMHACMHACMHAYIHTYIHTYMYVCVCVYIYIY